MTPRFSIVMPVLNGERYIRETLDSVVHQTFSDWEIVIFDGGSVDGTADIIAEYQKQYPAIHYYKEPCEGPYDAIMQGAAKTQGEFIGVMAVSDGYLNNQWLESCARVLESDTEVSLVWGIPFDMTEDGKIIGPHFAYAHFLNEPVSGQRASVFKKIISKLDIRNPRSFIRFIQKLHPANMRAVGHMMRKMSPPQKQQWFYHWLQTGMIFPDGNTIVSRRAFFECMPPYKKGSREPGDWMSFYFDFNAKGYLAHCLSVKANFGRIHGGQVSQVFQEYNEQRRTAYFKKITELRETLKRNPSQMVFIDRLGHPLSIRARM